MKRRARLLVALGALIGACVPPARAASELVLPPVERVTFENGLRVVVAEYHELPLVEFYLVVGAGAAQDPVGKEGVAALTAVAVRRGAGTRSADDLARTIESLGGALEAGAGIDGTIVRGEFLAEDFDAGVGLLHDILLAPTFARDEIRRAREEQLAALVGAMEEPSAVAEKCFAGFLYGQHPYGRDPGGRRASVADLGRGDVQDFFDHWYRPNNTVLVLVGDVQRVAAIARLREAFGGWAARADAVPQRVAPAPSSGGRRVLLVDMPSATQTQIRMGAVSMKRSDPDLTASNVGNTMLGGGFTSKLIEELRVKRSLTYSASSAYAARLTGGDFRISTFTKSATTVETLQLAQQVADDFRARTPDDKAFRKAKAYLLGQFPLRVETPEALAAQLADIEVHGLPKDNLETYRRRVGAVTPAEAARLTQAHMPAADTMAIVVVGKAAEVRAPLEAAYGPVTTITPEACDTLSAPAR